MRWRRQPLSPAIGAPWGGGAHTHTHDASYAFHGTRGEGRRGWNGTYLGELGAHQEEEEEAQELAGGSHGLRAAPAATDIDHLPGLTGVLPACLPHQLPSLSQQQQQQSVLARGCSLVACGAFQHSGEGQLRAALVILFACDALLPAPAPPASLARSLALSPDRRSVRSGARNDALR